MQDPVRIAAALLVILQTALVAAIAVRGLNAKRGGIAAELAVMAVAAVGALCTTAKLGQATATTTDCKLPIS